MKIIDGKNAVLGRLAGYAAKEALRGEEVVILNCEEILITGNKKNIEKNFREKRGRVGSTQKGPKHSRLTEKIVKRVIRGMLPTPRWGRGKEALKRIICFVGTPKKYEDAKKIVSGKTKQSKFVRIKEISK